MQSPRLLPNVPGGHGWQVFCDRSKYEPALQRPPAAPAAQAVEPIYRFHWFGGHSEQAAAFTAVEYLPIAHSLQSPAVPKVPGRHDMAVLFIAVHTVAPLIRDSVPSAHGMHFPGPAAALYDISGHCTQPEITYMLPALHVTSLQSALLSDPGGDRVLSAHCRQLVLPPVPYQPVGHGLHIPSETLVPGGQAAHAVAPAVLVNVCSAHRVQLVSDAFEL